MSSDSTALGDRMKMYEAVTQLTLPRRTYTIIRVDGRAFHSVLRNAGRPFDLLFMGSMDMVTQALCAEMSGAVLGYTHSDEASVLLTDFSSEHTEPWFGGNVQKMASIAAATATAQFNRRWPPLDPRKLTVEQMTREPVPATFDARVFTIPDPVEVMNYFVWRQRDCVRNSISMAARAQFSHKQLFGKNGNQIQEMLWKEKGINWNDYPDGAKRGRVCVRETGQEEITYTDKSGEEKTIEAVRSRWVTRPAEHFKAEQDSFLASMIRFPS